MKLWKMATRRLDAGRMLARISRIAFGAVLALSMAGAALAANRFSVAAGGNWSSTATWSTACLGAGGQSVPVAADNVTICAGTVTIDTPTAVATTVTVNTGGTLQVTAAANKLATTGTMTVTGAVSITLGWISVGNATTSQLILNNGAALTMNSGRLDVSGGLDSVSDAAVATFTMNGGNVYTQTLGAGTPTSLYLGQNTTFNMSGGTIFLVNGDGATYDLDIRSATSTITGGTIQLGDVGTPFPLTAPNQYAITNALPGTLRLPSLTFATSAARSTTLSLANPITITGNLTTNANHTFAFTGAGNAVTVSGNVSNAGTYTGAGNAITVTGDFTNTGTFTGAAGTISVAGNWTNSGAFTSTGTVTLNGNTATALGGTAATVFNNLTIGKSAAANTVSIAAGTPSPIVSTTLTLTLGKIVTSGASCAAATPIIVANAGTIAGGSATSYVQGALQKNFAAGAGVTLNFRVGAGLDEFPVGTASGYSPIEITAGTVTVGAGGGSLRVCVTATDDPNMTQALGGGIDTTKSVNRYWSMTNTNITAVTALMDATFKFNAGDLDAGPPNTGNFIVERWNGASWNPTTPVVGGALATSTRVQNVNLTVGTNEFEIGEPLVSFPPTLGTFNAFDQTSAVVPPASTVIANIQTKQSGAAFTVRVVRIANNAVDATYNQAGVTVELYNSSNNGGTFVAVPSCRNTWSAIGGGTSVTVNFAAGIATATFTGATMTTNSFRDVRIHVVRVGAGAGEGCSTDSFAIRPTSVTVAGLDATWQTAGTGRALSNNATPGGNVHAAAESTGTARPFTLRASPQPATATNYDGAPTAVSGFPVCCTPGTAPACATLPAACSAGTLSFTGGVSWTAAGSGVRENATASYSEAGVINVQLEDAGYASVDANDGSSAATRTIPAAATAQIGRFVPDHFTFPSSTAPAFRTYSTACVAARSFTYIGQPFWYLAASLPTATLNAVNANGTVTTNYRGALFKLTAAGFSETYSNNATGPSLDISLIGTPALSGVGNGTGTYTAAAAGTIAYQRSTAAAIPANSNPFTANLSLTVTATDNSEAGPAGNPASGALTSAPSLVFNGGGAGITFDAGALFRYGIMKLGNAVGSEKLDLPMPLQTQYWTGTGFTVNTADNCTSILLANVSFPTYYPNLAVGNMPAGNVSGGGAFAAGVGNLTVKKPTSSATGAVDVQIDLAAESKTWLQLLRTTPPGTYTQNPLGRAAFGLYGTQPGNFIYFRENY